MAIFPESKSRESRVKVLELPVRLGLSEVALGGVYSTLAGMAVVAMAAIVKWASHAFSTEFLMMVRFGMGLLTFLAIFLVRRQALPYRTSHPWLCSAVAAAWVGGIFCLYMAVRFISLTDAVLLNYTAPLFAPLQNRILLKKTESRAVWMGTGLGFVGVIIVLRPGADIFQIYALFGLMAGFLIALRLVINSFVARTESNEVITFYSLGVGWLICLAVLAVVGFHVANWQTHLFPPREWFQPWIIFPAVALAVVALGLLSVMQSWTTTAAYEHASVGEAGPFRYIGVIFAAFLDWLFWGVVPDLPSVLGFLFITVGGIWVITHQGKN